MPTGPRPTSRPGAGPGRGKPRARTAPRTSGPGPSDGPVVEGAPVANPARSARRPNLTARAVALVVVLLILTISYASSLRIYFAQANEIAATTTEISERQHKIADLQTELAQWADPAYVKTQARERLGWVMPGETGFKVVGADGKPLGGGAEIEAETAPEAAPRDAWWDTMWGSVETADKPAPVKPQPKPDKPITTETKPR